MPAQLACEPTALSSVPPIEALHEHDVDRAPFAAPSTQVQGASHCCGGQRQRNFKPASVWKPLHSQFAGPMPAEHSPCV